MSSSRARGSSSPRRESATSLDIDYRILSAQVEILAARWALRQGDRLPEGLDVERKVLASMVEKGRARPRIYAHAVKGSFYVLAARSTKGSKEARLMASKAKEALAAAVRGNALIVRDRKEIIEAADRLFEAASD